MTLPLKSYLSQMKVVLKYGLKQDVSDNKIARYLMTQGFISKDGRTTEKGKKALRLLK